MDDYENPYRAPKTREGDWSDGPNSSAWGGGPVPAGKGLRFLNCFIDNLATAGLGFVAGMVLGSTVGPERVDEYQGVAFFMGVGVSLAYFVLMEAAFGRTIGKLLTGTKVVNADGDPASFGQVLGRTLCRMIPFEAFSFLGETGRGWHDSISGTFVVKA